jgi:phage FluMu gp28-like protein
MNVDMEFCWEMARHDPRVFGQLFECKFLDGDFQYIPSELLKRQTVETPANQYGETWAGLDIGETRDRTCLVIVQGDKSRIQVSHCETHGKTDDELIHHLINKAFSQYGCTRLCLDRTGMGTFPSQRAVREHGPKVEPVLFGSKEKEAMAGRLYQTLADGILFLNRDDRDMTDDIMYIRRTVTEAGTVRFEAPRTAKGHADRAWALMLAVQASSLAGLKDAYSRLQGMHPKADVEDYDDDD